MDAVARIHLDVGVHNGHQLRRVTQVLRAACDAQAQAGRSQSPFYLAPLGGQLSEHVKGVRKTTGVPGEVALAISMLNVQPDDVTGQVVVVKALTDLQNVRLIPVVPAALVVAEGEERGKCLGSCRFSKGWGQAGLRPNQGPTGETQKRKEPQ